MSFQMSFQITDHNLPYILEQYAQWRHPSMITVPYDRSGLEVKIDAPSRDRVQAAVIRYDLLGRLGKNIGLDVHRNYFGTGLALVTGRTKLDPADFRPSLRAIAVGPGLTIFPWNREFLYTTQPGECGLERVTWVAPRFSETIQRWDGRPFRMECQGPGMYQGTDQ